MNLIPEHYQRHGLSSRWMVLEMLGKILVEKQMISDIKENPNFAFHTMLPEHKARSLSLLETILRNMSALDAVINTYLNQKTSIRVINILRIASAEMLIDKIAVHAAVDSAVRLAKLDTKLSRFSGLINAVCRKISKRLTDGSNLDESRLCNDFILMLQPQYDEEAIKKFSLSQAKRPSLDITLKDKSLHMYYANLFSGNILVGGTLRVENKKQISKLAGYEKGDWWIQDFAASIPVKLLGELEDLSVLDVCAAPGGKTMQLSSKGARVTALDISKKRVKTLKENLRRTGLEADVVVEDIFNFQAKKLFDVVLVDAPCSATGTIRRNCDLQYLEPAKRIDSLVKVQKSILKRAMKFVKPGGRLVYCTCSLMLEEGENVVNNVIQNQNGWTQLPIQTKEVGVSSEWVDEQGGLRLRPDYWSSIGGMDGFYIALLIKKN